MTSPNPEPKSPRGTPGEPEEAPADLPAAVERCLVDLAVALGRFSMYPPGHPALGPAADEVLDSLRALLRERGTLEVRGRRDRVRVGGAESDPSRPHLRALAERLHDHQLARVTFLAGLEEAELASFLSVMAVDPSRGGEPLGLRGEEVRSWPHVRLEPQRYDPLRLDERGEAPADEALRSGDAGEAEGGAGTRSGVLEAPVLAEAPLGSRIGPVDLASESPTEAARRLEAGLGAEDADRVVAFQIMRMAERLAAAQGGDSDRVRERMSGMILCLQPDTLAYLLRFGEEGGRDEDLLVTASEGLETEAALRLVRAAAERRGEGIESWLLRLVSKLAMYAGPRTRPPPESAGESAEKPKRAEDVNALIDRIVADWNLEDPRPSLYRRTLRRITRTPPAPAGRPIRPLAVEPERYVQMGLEMDELARDVRAAADTLVETRRVPELVHMVDSAPRPSRAAEALWDRLAVPETVEGLLNEPNPDFDLLKRIVLRAGAVVAGPLLDALSDSNAGSRAYWHNVFALLVEIGEPVADLVPPRLEDERWFVRRNLLALLYELPRRPGSFTALPYLDDPEPRVRADALRLALEEPEGRHAALVAGLRDDNERVVGLALSAATEALPADLEPLVARRAEDRTLAPALRARAVRILGGLGTRTALQTLLSVVWVRRWLFWRRIADPSSPVLAALEALATRWPGDPDARAAVEAARASDDGRVREAAAGRVAGEPESDGRGVGEVKGGEEAPREPGARGAAADPGDEGGP